MDLSLPRAYTGIVFPTRSRVLQLALAGLALVLCVWLVASFLPVDTEYTRYYYAAGRAALELRNPYQVRGFFNPAWILLLFAPLSLLSPQLGHASYFMLSLGAAYYAARRFGASLPGIVLFLCSPLMLAGLLLTNVDSLVLLGAVLPPQFGLFLVLLKPQVGSGIALYWLWQAWRTGGWRQVVRTFAPVSLALLLTLVLYGNWLTRGLSLTDAWWNMSLFPWLIPVGCFLAWLSLRRSALRLSVPVGVCFSPYVGPSSTITVLVPLLSNTRLLALACALVWLWRLKG